jgi:hypothetical protein
MLDPFVLKNRGKKKELRETENNHVVSSNLRILCNQSEIVQKKGFLLGKESAQSSKKKVFIYTER